MTKTIGYIDNQIWERLDAFEERIPVPALEESLAECVAAKVGFWKYVKLRDDFYNRTLVREGPNYQALILTWKAGQVSPIHNHRGSNCAVAVLSGTASEIIFGSSGSGLIYPIRTTTLNEGSTTVSADEDIHQMGNLAEDERPLVTLHIYSPKLVGMEIFELDRSIYGNYEDLVESSRGFPAYSRMNLD